MAPKLGFLDRFGANSVDNVVLLMDAPNRDNAIAFTDFLLIPENVAAVLHYANFCQGLSGVGECLDPEFAWLPESSPPAVAGPGKFIEVCDAATQVVRGQIWTNVKK